MPERKQLPADLNRLNGGLIIAYMRRAVREQNKSEALRLLRHAKTERGWGRKEIPNDLYWQIKKLKEK